MLILLLLIASPVFAENCSDLFDGVVYSRRSIFTIKGLPTNLAYNQNNKDLHFTVIDIDSLQDDDVQTKMEQYVLANGHPIKIDDINGQAAAVDNRNNKVYIASDDGLNVLNGSYQTNFLAFKDEDITQLFKTANNDKLYAVIFPDSEVYEIDLQRIEKRRIENVPCAFILAVDDDGNIYYECDSKYVKVLLKDFVEPIEYVGLTKNAARAMAIDDRNRVILAANDGLYWLQPNSIIPKKLMNLDFIPSGIVFNGYDFFISTSGIIYEFNLEFCEQ
ncbi:unnamed protein product [Danaus chrysippus]|uniref:(African queen) hypothetical protein n=1 Tax=Danaus chrysippus TaxID=151541 RepID=A0A8J2QW88_9NEOP|nr:unnamed protein product [Danaus chrysippus]